MTRNDRSWRRFGPNRADFEPGRRWVFPIGLSNRYARGMNRSPLVQLLALVLVAGLRAEVATGQGPVRPNSEYLVVASERCRATDGWRQVVGALAAKHDAEMIFFAESPLEILPELRRRSPRIIGVVAMPDEAGRDRVGSLNRLFRRINDDPWLDVRWGLVTGAEWADAMEVVRTASPLVISRLLSNTPVPFQDVADGVWFDEGVAGRRMERSGGGDPREILGDREIADDFAAAFNDAPPDLLVTSGRTNEERWMLGYLFDGGRVVVGAEGDLRARRLDGTEIPLRNPGPMAMLGAGSCLLGFVPNDGVLPLAFIHDAGARQIVGYASTTWHGAGGWDVFRRFLEEPGRWTLAESTWIAQQELIRRFRDEFPGVEEFSTEGFGEREVPEFQFAISEATGMPRTDPRFKDLAGYLWDRDAIVLLGDPEWSVRMPDGPLPWSSEVRRSGDRLVIDLVVNLDLSERATPVVILEDRIAGSEVLRGKELDPVVTPDLVFLPGLRGSAAGTRHQIELIAPVANLKEEIVPPAPEAVNAALSGHLESDHPKLRVAIETSKANAGEIVAAIRGVPAEHRQDMAFLISNMPAGDLRTMPATVLLENVAAAHASFAASPWSAGVPRDVFREAVLPYAHINERRDDWRGDFTRRFRDIAHGEESQAAAVRLLNQMVYETFDVVFDSNKRLKNEQSPYQTIDQNCASCTGLSILLANACRAAGIPARIAGIPEWPTGDNHTWVEVYDPIDQQWHWIEAFGGGEYDEGWWVEKVRGIASEDSAEPRYRIWAASWSRPAGVPDRFPLWWLTDRDDPVPGIDRTKDYARRR